MALITPGALAGEIRGSMGGITFSRNSSGAYMRNRVTPVNPSSNRQNVVRGQLSQLASRWSNTLTQAQRDGWNLYASQTPLVNKIGQSFNPSGQMMYTRGNAVALQAGLAIVDDAPGILGEAATPVGFDATIDTTGQTVDVEFDNTVDWANEDDAAMLIQVSRPFSPGRTFVGGPFAVVGAVEGDATTAPTSPQSLNLIFPTNDLEVVKVRARVVRADRRVSPYLAVTFPA